MPSVKPKRTPAILFEKDMLNLSDAREGKANIGRSSLGKGFLEETVIRAKAFQKALFDSKKDCQN